ncbi:MAG TPA: RraA family protein [Thermodesulfobacteriota bacterium]|nr:RraA family protein [Thermodesulfobacteriota bacterium]
MEIKPVQRPPKEIIEGLRAIDTSTISDVLDDMGLDCLVSGAIRGVDPAFSIVGPAVTIKQVSGVAGTYTMADFAMSKLLDAAQAGDVLVFDNSGKEISTWGGLASTAAQEKGIEGVVVDGGSRDADEVARLKFPVFSRHVTPRTGKTRTKMLEMNGEIQCGGIRVRPGDVIVADRTGIIVIPRDRAAEVLQKCRNVVNEEKTFAQGLKTGKSFGDMHKKTGAM